MTEPTRTRRSFAQIFRMIWPPLPVWRRLDLAVISVAIYTTLVVAIDLSFAMHLPNWGGVSTILNALVLGILLGFRNKESYERWWEARKLWGQLINDSRSLCAKAAALLKLSPEGRADLGRLVCDFAFALKNRLRGDGGATHVPLHLFTQLTTLLQTERSAGRLTEVDLLTLDPHVRGLMDVCGACERIKNAPLPQSYRSLLRHGLVLYLLSTPWLIADHMSWWSIPVMSLFAYFLLGVELTAEDVEEPFGRDGDDLTLSTYCETIRRSVEQVLGAAQG